MALLSVGLERKGRPRLRRRIVHIALGTLFILSLLTWDGLKWPLLALLVLGTCLSILQDKRPLRSISWFLDRYDKVGDQVPGQGPITFFSGALVVWFIFGGSVALAALIVLTFGDPLANIIGSVVGRCRIPWNREKTLEGSIAFYVSSGAVLALVLGPAPGFVLAAIGSLVETGRARRSLLLDDNILIPVVVALSAWVLDLCLPSFI